MKVRDVDPLPPFPGILWVFVSIFSLECPGCLRKVDVIVVVLANGFSFYHQ